MLARAGLHSTLDLGKLQAETSLIFESVQRGGSDFEVLTSVVPYTAAL